MPGHHIQVDVKFLTFAGKARQKVRRDQRFAQISPVHRDPGEGATAANARPARSTPGTKGSARESCARILHGCSRIVAVFGGRWRFPAASADLQNMLETQGPEWWAL
jgi:hypothetical protein